MTMKIKHRPAKRVTFRLNFPKPPVRFPDKFGQILLARGEDDWTTAIGTEPAVSIEEYDLDRD
jgi:hypothetical protein